MWKDCCVGKGRYQTGREDWHCLQLNPFRRESGHNDGNGSPLAYFLRGRKEGGACHLIVLLVDE